eukprot:gene21632-26019_t
MPLVPMNAQQLTARRVIRLVFIIFALLTIPVLVWIVRVMYLRGAETHVIGWAVGGVLLALLILPTSLYQIDGHLEHYTKPHLQRHIIRVVWMVPIYAINSWLALSLGVLCLPEGIKYLDALRECYEAFTVYSFFSFLLNYLTEASGGDLAGKLKERGISRETQGKPPMTHMFPFAWGSTNFIPAWKMGQDFVDYCKIGVLSYVVLKPTTTFITVISQLLDIYGDGEMLNFNK